MNFLLKQKPKRDNLDERIEVPSFSLLVTGDGRSKRKCLKKRFRIAVFGEFASKCVDIVHAYLIIQQDFDEVFRRKEFFFSSKFEKKPNVIECRCERK